MASKEGSEVETEADFGPTDFPVVQGGPIDEGNHKWVDVLGSGELWKKVVVSGKGRESRPERGQEVHIALKVFIDGDFDESSSGEFTMIVGENDIAYALDLVLALMQVGEISFCKTTSRYDSRSLPQPTSTVHYQVELLSVNDPVAAFDMDEEARLTFCHKKKERGNELFGQREFDLAAAAFQKAINSISESRSDTVLSPVMVELKVACLTNLAAAQLNLNRYKVVVDTCEYAIALQPKCPKAFFRKAKALHKLNEFKDAITTLKQLLKLEPNNGTARTFLTKVTKDHSNNKETERNFYSKMVSALDGSSADVQATIKTQENKKAEEANKQRKLEEKEADVERKKELEQAESDWNRNVITVIGALVVIALGFATTFLFTNGVFQTTTPTVDIKEDTITNLNINADL